MTPRKIFLIALYTLIGLTAIGVEAKIVSLETLIKDNDNIKCHERPVSLPVKEFLNENNQMINLSIFKGKMIIMNFWATWCGPCREEMPSLDKLQERFGGDDFEVITIATGRNPMPMIERFFERENIKYLPKYRDPKMHLSKAMNVMNLPVTILINKEGMEICRIKGSVDWTDEKMLEFLADPASLVD